jgi:hypothetical protein
MKGSRSTARPRAGARLLTALTLALLCAASTAPVQAAPKTGVVAGSGNLAGEVFTAGSSGAEYQLPSRIRLSLAPGASVRIFREPQQLQLTPGNETNTYSFALLRGRVDVSVPATSKSAVLCRMGPLSAVIGTGQASMLATGERATVASVAGDVRTLLSVGWQALPPGTVARFGGGRSGSPEPMIAAPRLSPGQRLWLSSGGPIAISGFAFEKVPAAARYQLLLRAKDGSGEQLLDVVGATRLSEPFTPISPGEYLIAARSVDAEGIASTWSSSETVRIIGVTLPPGGYSADGEFFVGKGQHVLFSHTEGLEMTYEGSGRYIRASQAVPLYRDETTVVSFRVPGSSFSTSARLRRRSLYAQVEIGPSRAVWPDDPVQIVVELKSRNGQAIPDWLEPKLEVRLGIEPIAVSFTRRGSRLVGTVPPPNQPGPWVLRVEVKDQFGASLGRDFLEIAKAPAAPLAKALTRVASK